MARFTKLKKWRRELDVFFQSIGYFNFDILVKAKDGKKGGSESDGSLHVEAFLVIDLNIIYRITSGR